MNLAKFTRILFLFAIFEILSTVVLATCMHESLKTICICISNHLAYSWIAFGFSSVLAMIILAMKALCQCDENHHSRLIKVLFVFQLLSFMTGIFFLVYFGTRVTDVI